MDDFSLPGTYSRRELLRLSRLLSVGGALPLLSACAQRQARQPNAPVRIGYLPITDATPLLVAHARGLFQQHGLEAERPRMFRSWSQLVEAFIFGQVNVVHLLSPITLWMRYNAQIPAKVAAWCHTDGSALTVAPHIEHLSQLAGQTVAVPFWYSIHNVIAQRLLREQGLNAVTRPGQPLGPRDVRLLVMSPADMVPALAAGQIAGFLVAEPFNALAEIKKVGKVARFTGDVWKDHACCVIFMHEHDLSGRPQWSQGVLNAVVDAQLWTRAHRAEAAQMLSREAPGKYTPHLPAVLRRVLADDMAPYQQSGAVLNPQWGQHRIDFQPYPYPSYTAALVEQLQHTRMQGDTAFLQRLNPLEVAADLVDDRYVTRSLQAAGGPAAFGKSGYLRREVFAAPSLSAFSSPPTGVAL